MTDFPQTGLANLFDQTLGAAAASFDTGAVIPPGYSALEIILYARGDAATTAIEGFLQFNGDTAANYDIRWIRNTGNTAQASSSIGATSITIGYQPAATGPANYFDSAWMVVASYDNTVGYKHCNSIYGDVSSTGGQQTWAQTAIWKSTSAINRIKIAASSGNFVTGSRLIVYGRP